jgi:superfamily II RNA helicase
MAMANELARGGRSWYASPLKALSNAKYLEFSRKFGEAAVGLLTGDLRINSQAPIVVGTTEILRNQLYDAMALSGGGELGRELVVLDEAHYLGDPQRGVVWEEVLIYLPARVRLLMLSATVDNADELAAWLSHNRCQPTRVVLGGQRPVPLVPLCYGQNRLETLAQAIKRPGLSQRGRPEGRGLRPPQVLRALAGLDLTPAIFFLPTRRQCDLAAKSIPPPIAEDPERRTKRLALIKEYEGSFPFLRKRPAVVMLKRGDSAAHHAGHLPVYKMLVEELMSQGLLSAIFATSTVSAGVDFPARTVVVAQSDRFNGTTYDPLTATELAQMTGRAGRRGRDSIGFAVVLPGPFTRLKYLQALFNSPPEPIKSQLLMNFPMALNLVAALELSEIRRLLAQSLAAWQTAPKKTATGLGQAAGDLWRGFMAHLKFLKTVGLVDGQSRLTAWGELTAKIRLEHPLILYQAIREAALPAHDPALLAGVVASFLNEKNSASPTKPPKDLARALKAVQAAIKPMALDLINGGFPCPAMDLGAAWAAYSWAKGKTFEEIAGIYGQDEGDAVRLVLRAAEHLNQLKGLPGQEELAKTATEARQGLLREPVV